MGWGEGEGEGQGGDLASQTHRLESDRLDFAKAAKRGHPLLMHLPKSILADGAPCNASIRCRGRDNRGRALVAVSLPHLGAQGQAPHHCSARCSWARHH